MTKNTYRLPHFGISKIILSLIGALVSISIFVYSALQMTPYSVHVSSYSRSDGTQVRSYNRRPPGGEQHDAPYEAMAMIFGISGLFCSAYSGIKIKGFIEFDTDRDLLRNYKFSFSYPTLGIFEMAVPEIKIVPKKTWHCSSCDNIIEAGSVYFYYSSESQSNHSHICRVCRENAIQHYQKYRE